MRSAIVPTFNFTDVFFLDANGIVVDVSAELSTLLNVKIGDSIEPAVFQELYEQDQTTDSDENLDWMETIELRDRFGLKRRIVLHKIDGPSNERRYAALQPGANCDTSQVQIEHCSHAHQPAHSKNGLPQSE